jgi:hypothetical protein
MSTPDEMKALIAEARGLTPEGRAMLTSHERMMHRLADALEAATTSMPDEQLDAIEKRANAATEGAWSAADEHGLMSGAMPAWCVSRLDAVGRYRGDVAYLPQRDGVEQPDAEFIAHAREDVPALIAEVRRLRALSAHPAEEAVTTVEELDALPYGSWIGIERGGWFIAYERRGRDWQSVGGSFFDADWLPARVLFRPVPTDREGQS